MEFVNIILDARRVEKYEPLMQELKRQQIRKVEIVPCIMIPNIVESISESFKMIIRNAKDAGLKEVCIMEDDVMFPNKNGWNYFLENKPKEFDLYIGGSYLIDNRIEYKSPITKVPEYVGNHCIIVNESYYDTWLSTDPKKHCDTVHAGLGNFYLCFPMVSLQRPGFSANTQVVVNYNSNIPDGYIY